MHSREIHCLFIAGLIWRGLGVDVTDERELGEKFVHVFELARKRGQLVQIFPAQFVIGEIHFGVIVVNRLNHRRDHLRRRIRLTAGCDFVERVRKLSPIFFGFRAHVHRQQTFAPGDDLAALVQ